jgi:hypothetical protein
MELTILIIILLIGIYLFYTSKETLCNCDKCNSIEKLTNVPDIDIRALKIQDYTRYKSLIFGDQPQFTNTILT